jgi:hypothetical protein
VTQIIESTGEIVEDNFAKRFYDLDTAEHELFESMGEELSAKVKQIRLLHLINQRELYRQRLDDDGMPLVSMRQYIQSIAPRLEAIGIGKERSLLAWLVKYKVFVTQLGKPESYLQYMGSHCDALIPAAARFDPTSQLLDEDVQTKNGKRLGRENFLALADEIEERVKESIEHDISWSVKDTRDRVLEVMGKEVDPKPKIAVSAKYVNGEDGQRVKVSDFGIWLDTYFYSLSDLIPLEHFKLIARNWKVDGLGEFL